MSTTIGKVSVKVFPDTKGFRKELEAQLQGVRDIDIEVKADTKGFQAEVKAMAKAASGEKVKVDAGFQDGFAARMQAELKAAAAAIEAEIPLTADGEGLRRDLEAEVAGLQAQLSRMKLQVPLDVEDAAGEKAELAAAIGALQAQAKANPVTIPVKTDRKDFDVINDRLHRLADGVGRAFGRGKRNNFFHALGSGMRFLTKALAAPIQLVGSLVGAVRAGVGVFNEMREAGMGLAKSIGGGLMSAIQTFSSSLPSLIVGATMVALSLAAVGAIVPMVTMALGALFALLSTVAMAIVGSLAPLVPLLVALGAAAGVAAGAIAMIWDDIKAGTGAFRGARAELDKLKASLKSIGEDIAPSLGRLGETILGGVRRAVREMGPVIGGLIDDLNRKINDPRMDRFYRKWRTEMPSIVSNFGKGLNSLANALVAFFAPVLDIADELSAKFKNAMDRFLDWTTSAKGQNTLKNFFEDAWAAAKLVWETIKNLTIAIGDMISQSNSTAGMGFFETLNEWMLKLQGWAQKPIKISDLVKFDGVDMGTAKAGGMPGSPLAKGTSPFEDFIADARAFATEMREVAGEIGKFFSELNKPENRKRAIEIADAISTLAKALQLLADAINAIPSVIPDWLSNASKGGWKNLKKTAEEVKDILNGGPGAGPSMGEGLHALGLDLGKLTGDGFNLGFKNSLSGGGKSGIGVNSILSTVLNNAGVTAQTGGKNISGGVSSGMALGIPGVIAAGVGLGQSAITGLGNLIPGFSLKGLQGAGGMAGGLASGLSGVIGAASSLVTGADAQAIYLATKLRAKGLQGATGMAGGVISGQGSVSTSVGTITQAAQNRATQLATQLRAKGYQGAAGMAGGITSGSGAVGAAAGSLKNAAVRGASAGIEGSMRATGARGSSSMAGGLRGGTGTVGAAAGTLKAASVRGVASLPGEMRAKGSGGSSGLAGGLRGGAGAVSGAAGTLKAASIRGVASLPGEMRSRGSASGQGLAGGISGKVGAVGGASGSLKATAIGRLGGMEGSMRTHGAQGGQGVADGISSKTGAVGGASGSIKAAATSPLSGLGGTLTGAGSSLIGGFISGIKSRIGDVRSALGGITSKLRSWKGPPKKDRTILIPAGHDVIDGFVDGLQARTGRVKDTLTDLTNNLPNWKGPAKRDRTILRTAGEMVIEGFEDGLRESSSRVRDALEDLTKAIPKVMTNSTARSRTRNAVNSLLRDLDKWDTAFEKWQSYTDLAKKMQDEKVNFAGGMLDKSMDLGGLSNIEDGFDEVIYRLKTAKEMTAEFGKYLATLRKNGLNNDLYSQIAALGPEQGMAAAKAIAEAGKKGVQEVNKLQEELLKTSGNVAHKSAGYLYNDGILMATNFANGFARQLNSVEKRMTKTVRSMVAAINREFKAAGLDDRLERLFVAGSQFNAGTPGSSRFVQASSQIGGGTNILNYYAAPGNYNENEKQLFDAFRRVGFN